MTERPYDPAGPGRRAGGGGQRAVHRRPAQRHAGPRRHGRRPPGRAVAAGLSLVLGVSVAMLWTARYGGRPEALGAPASIAFADPSGADDARPAADRAGRGEQRAAPGPTGPERLPAGQPAAPVRTLVPTTDPAPSAPAPSTPAAGSGAAGSGAAGSGAPADTSVTGEVVRLTNVERAKGGCGPLHVDPRLTAAAQGHSEDMANRGYFAHDTPEGKTPWDRAKAAGYADPSAENIAMGYRTAADVVAGWMGSPGHRANILNCDSHAVGIGYDQRGFYWTQLFGFV